MLTKSLESDTEVINQESEQSIASKEVQTTKKITAWVFPK